MKYNKIVKATFIDRPNRFIAHVALDGRIETVHVKNTGRCRELLLPDIPVILEDCEGHNPNRKTRYDLIAVYKEHIGWVNIDSQAPNKAVYEWLQSNPDNIFIKPEYRYGESRIDFYVEQGDQQILLEVKGCTLEIDGIGYFPDAPTERGVKHLKELAEAVKRGYQCAAAFVIQMNGITEVRPNINTHPAFAVSWKEAKEAGVKILFLRCKVTEDELVIADMGEAL